MDKQIRQPNFFHNRGLSGIVNLGNTCYINSALQCLSHTLPLTQYFLSEKFREDASYRKPEYKLCKEFFRVLHGLWHNNCIIRPLAFKQVLAAFDSKYAMSAQHDSQEVLSKILDLLHQGTSYRVQITPEGTPLTKMDEMEQKSIEKWGRDFDNQYSRVIELFYGQFNSIIRCQKCGYESISYDSFCTLNIPIGDECRSIYDCLDLFTKTEHLDNDNQWKCDKCHQLSNASKNIYLWKVPDHIIITLKRFDLNYNKITRRISFPMENLNMENYVNGYDKYNAHYDLYAISNHTGQTYGGHYYSYCKNANGKWYEFNDTTVKEIPPGRVVSDHAYVLFYKRRAQ